MRKGQFHEAAVMGGKHNVGHAGGLRSQAHAAAKSRPRPLAAGTIYLLPPNLSFLITFWKIIILPTQLLHED